MVPWRQLTDRVNGDPEFRLSARHWNATLRLDFEGTSQRLRFEEGALVEVGACGPEADCDVFVGAPDATWRELLTPEPRPFYQDLYGAQIHHGVRLPADPLAFAAYYPALRRLVQLLSAARQESR